MSLLDDDLVDKEIGQLQHIYKFIECDTDILDKEVLRDANLQDFYMKEVNKEYNKNDWDAFVIYNKDISNLTIQNFIARCSGISIFLLNKIMNALITYIDDKYEFYRYLQFPCTNMTIDKKNEYLYIKFYKKKKMLAMFGFIEKSYTDDAS